MCEKKVADEVKNTKQSLRQSELTDFSMNLKHVALKEVNLYPLFSTKIFAYSLLILHINHSQNCYFNSLMPKKWVIVNMLIVFGKILCNT